MCKPSENVWWIWGRIRPIWVSIPKEKFWLEKWLENQLEIPIWFCDMSKQLISSNFLIVILAWKPAWKTAWTQAGFRASFFSFGIDTLASRAFHRFSPRRCHSSSVDPSTNPRRRPIGRRHQSRGERQCNRHRRRPRGRVSGSTSWTPAGWSGRNREDIQWYWIKI